jgi:porin
MKNSSCATTLLATCLIAALSPAYPADVAEPTAPETKSKLRQFAERDYLTGDWGGVRTNLSQRGVDFEFLYAGAVPSSLDGGLKHGSVYQGALLMMMELDSEKLLRYQNGHFRASGLWLHSGDAFSKNYVGDLNQVSMLDFPDSFRLWELWYEHKFFDRKLSLKAGQLDIGMDFIVPEFYNSIGAVSFLNQTFFYPTMAFNVYDQPFFPVGYHALASTPYGAPGARLRYDPSPRFYVQAGVYDGNPDRSFSGTRINLNSDEGALSYFEICYRHNQDKNDTGLPGNFKLGAYYHTDDFVDMYEGSFVAFDNALMAMGQPPLGMVTDPRWRSGNYGLYFLADHMLWRERGPKDLARQGLTGFFRVAYAPQDRNLAQFGIDGGIVYKGLIPTRDWDTLGVAGSYLQISDDLRRAQRDLNTVLSGYGMSVPIADYEAVLELNYKAQMTAWWTVQTSVQRVFHPGGRVLTATPDAWAVIVQSSLRF